jgi:hypothetical protein
MNFKWQPVNIWEPFLLYLCRLFYFHCPTQFDMDCVTRGIDVFVRFLLLESNLVVCSSLLSWMRLWSLFLCGNVSVFGGHTNDHRIREHRTECLLGCIMDNHRAINFCCGTGGNHTWDSFRKDISPTSTFSINLHL